jgi:hypothetical protein
MLGRFLKFVSQCFASRFAPKEHRKLAATLWLETAPAKPRVLKGRRKTSAQFHRACGTKLFFQ